MKDKKYDTDYFEVSVLEGGIVRTFIKNNTFVDEDMVEEIKTKCKEAMESVQAPFLFVLGQYVDISVEGRQAAQINKYGELELAKAVVVDSLGQRIIVNYLFSQEVSHHSKKIFSNEKSAVEWLRVQVSLNIESK